jgi:hypothetical protein
MAAIRSRWVVLPAMAGLALVGLGAAPAAARPATLVRSDGVKFSALVSGTKATLTFKSTSCALSSDGELKIVPCVLTGSFSTTPPFPGTAKLVSADGVTTWKFTLTPISSTSAKMKGAGVETDASEGGKPSRPYPATMSGIWTIGVAAPTISGSVVVSESSTAP